MAQLLLFPDPRPLVEKLGADFFRHAPESAGVYLMRDAGETVLYVGKARNLRKRLTYYRVANPDRIPRRHLRLLRAVQQIQFELCLDESSALARESELLRSLRPRFNRAGTWPGGYVGNRKTEGLNDLTFFDRLGMATDLGNQMNPLAKDMLTGRFTELISRTLLWVLLACAVLICAGLWTQPGATSGQDSSATLVMVLAGAIAWVSAARELPLQNVILASTIIGLSGLATNALAGLLNIEMPSLVRQNLWAGPLAWITAILNSRALARLVLVGKSRSSSAGLWLLGWATIFATLYGLGTQMLRACWGGEQATSMEALFRSAAIYTIASALILVATTPALLNKKPVESPPRMDALWLWLIMNVLFVSAAWTLQQRLLAISIVICNLGLSAIVLKDKLWTTHLDSSKS